MHWLCISTDVTEALQHGYMSAKGREAEGRRHGRLLLAGWKTTHILGEHTCDVNPPACVML